MTQTYNYDQAVTEVIKFGQWEVSVYAPDGDNMPVINIQVTVKDGING